MSSLPANWRSVRKNSLHAERTRPRDRVVQSNVERKRRLRGAARAANPRRVAPAVGRSRTRSARLSRRRLHQDRCAAEPPRRRAAAETAGASEDRKAAATPTSAALLHAAAASRGTAGRGTGAVACCARCTARRPTDLKPRSNKVGLADIYRLSITGLTSARPLSVAPRPGSQTAAAAHPIDEDHARALREAIVASDAKKAAASASAGLRAAIARQIASARPAAPPPLP